MKPLPLTASLLKDGTGSYLPVDAVPVPAHGILQLMPERLAQRLNGLTVPLHQGETLSMQITLGGRTADVTVAIKPEGARRHSHAGHKH